MSDTARAVSGRTYLFEPNGLGFQAFSLTFEEDLALFEFSFRGKTVQVEVGTDGAFRMTESAGFVRAYQGTWSAPDTFAMRYRIVGTGENGGLEITFSEDTATVVFFEAATGTREVMGSRWHPPAGAAPSLPA